MNELEILKNEEFGEIRIIMIDNEPWFVGKDVAEILGYVDANKAISMHIDEDDKLNDKTASSLGQRGGWFINESGLYSLILSSKLPTAKKFKRWVTSEVLPSIRKTGTCTKPADDRPTEVILSEALLIAKDTMEKQSQVILELEEQLINAKGLCILRDIVRLIDYSLNTGHEGKLVAYQDKLRQGLVFIESV